jgi:hypothetical protein
MRKGVSPNIQQQNERREKRWRVKSNNDNDLVAFPLGLEILRVLEQLLAKQTRLVQLGKGLSLFFTILLAIAIAIKTIQYAASPSIILSLDRRRRRRRLSCRGAEFCTHGTRVACISFATERGDVERRSKFLKTVVYVV